MNIFGGLCFITGISWVGLANIIKQDSINGESLGGYGLLVTGIIVLWRELKCERKRSDERHGEHLKFTEEQTKVLKNLTDKK